MDIMMNCLFMHGRLNNRFSFIFIFIFNFIFIFILLSENSYFVQLEHQLSTNIMYKKSEAIDNRVK